MYMQGLFHRIPTGAALDLHAIFFFFHLQMNLCNVESCKISLKIPLYL